MEERNQPYTINLKFIAMKEKLLPMLLLALLGMFGVSATVAAQTPEPGETMEIGTAEDLNAFVQFVENGADVNGLLTADIDLSTSDYPNLMIGTESSPFKGKFDGQGHTITYHYANVTEKWRGLFACIAIILFVISNEQEYNFSERYSCRFGNIKYTSGR